VGIVKMLLERKDVDPNQIFCSYGVRPVPWAAAKGNAELADAIMERKGLSPGMWTPNMAERESRGQRRGGGRR